MIKDDNWQTVNDQRGGRLPDVAGSIARDIQSPLAEFTQGSPAENACSNALYSHTVL